MDDIEVSSYLIEVGKFERFYKEVQIHDLQNELDEWTVKNNFKKYVSLVYNPLMKAIFSSVESSVVCQC